MDKLPIKIESVTMSSVVYEELCNQVSKQKIITTNLSKFLNGLNENGIIIEAPHSDNFFIDGWERMSVINVMDMRGGTTKILLEGKR